MITSERGGQFYVTREKYDDILAYTKEKKELGYFVVDFDRGNGVFSAILEKECGITDQRIVWSKTFNEESIIKKWWDQGFNLSGLEHDGTDWIYIFSKYKKKHAQAFNYDSDFPSDSIKDRWDNGYSISKICHGGNTWVIVFTKGIDYHPGWATRTKLDLDEMNKWIEDGKIITDLVYGDEKWAMTFGKHKQYSYQTIEVSNTFPTDKIHEKWDNGYDISLCAYGEKKWVMAFSTKNKEKAKENDAVSKELATLELMTEVDDAYKKDEYATVIKTFEKNQSILKDEEEAVNCYLWSLWMSEGTEEKAYNLAKEYQSKFNTKRWLLLRGHYCKWKKWYDFALKNYKNCSEKNYKEIKAIFDDFQTLVNDKEYKQAIDYFESNLYNSISEDHLDVAHSYARALYQNDGTESNALATLEGYIKTYPNHKPFISLAGHVSKYLGEKDDDLTLLEKSLGFFKQIKETEKVKEVKESIKSVKAKVKQILAETKKAKEREEKMKQHHFKTARGITFCKHCGKDSSWSGFDCKGQENGHNYTAQKIDGEWQPMCTKCAKDKSWSDYSCG